MPPGRAGRGLRPERHQGEAGGLGGHVLRLPAAAPTLPADTPVFTVPAKLVRILDRDLKAAGIPKRDERGRTVDVHAMRHTFGTLLSKGGVTPRTAQAAMRHSTIDLTMNVYTDPKLLDVAGAWNRCRRYRWGLVRKRKPNRRKVQRGPTIRPLRRLHQSLHQLPANRAYWGQFWTRRPATGGKPRKPGPSP